MRKYSNDTPFYSPVKDKPTILTPKPRRFNIAHVNYLELLRNLHFTYDTSVEQWAIISYNLVSRKH